MWVKGSLVPYGDLDLRLGENARLELVTHEWPPIRIDWPLVLRNAERLFSPGRSMPTHPRASNQRKGKRLPNTSLGSFMRKRFRNMIHAPAPMSTPLSHLMPAPCRKLLVGLDRSERKGRHELQAGIPPRPLQAVLRLHRHGRLPLLGRSAGAVFFGSAGGSKHPHSPLHSSSWYSP